MNRIKSFLNAFLQALIYFPMILIFILLVSKWLFGVYCDYILDPKNVAIQLDGSIGFKESAGEWPISEYQIWMLYVILLVDLGLILWIFYDDPTETYMFWFGKDKPKSK